MGDLVRRHRVNLAALDAAYERVTPTAPTTQQGAHTPPRPDHVAQQDPSHTHSTRTALKRGADDDSNRPTTRRPNRRTDRTE